MHSGVCNGYSTIKERFRCCVCVHISTLGPVPGSQYGFLVRTEYIVDPGMHSLVCPNQQRLVALKIVQLGFPSAERLLLYAKAPEMTSLFSNEIELVIKINKYAPGADHVPEESLTNGAGPLANGGASAAEVLTEEERAALDAARQAAEQVSQILR